MSFVKIVILQFSQFMGNETFCVIFKSVFSKTGNVLLALTSHPEPSSVRVWTILENGRIDRLKENFGPFSKMAQTRTEDRSGCEVRASKTFPVLENTDLNNTQKVSFPMNSLNCENCNKVSTAFSSKNPWADN